MSGLFGQGTIEMRFALDAIGPVFSGGAGVIVHYGAGAPTIIGALKMVRLDAIIGNVIGIKLD